MGLMSISQQVRRTEVIKDTRFRLANVVAHDTLHSTGAQLVEDQIVTAYRINTRTRSRACEEQYKRQLEAACEAHCAGKTDRDGNPVCVTQCFAEVDLLTRKCYAKAACGPCASEVQVETVW